MFYSEDVNLQNKMLLLSKLCIRLFKDPFDTNYNTFYFVACQPASVSDREISVTLHLRGTFTTLL